MHLVVQEAVYVISYELNSGANLSTKPSWHKQ
jgi:hypothetical protein